MTSLAKCLGLAFMITISKGGVSGQYFSGQSTGRCHGRGGTKWKLVEVRVRGMKSDQCQWLSQAESMNTGCSLETRGAVMKRELTCKGKTKTNLDSLHSVHLPVWPWTRLIFSLGTNF